MMVFISARPGWPPNHPTHSPIPLTRSGQSIRSSLRALGTELPGLFLQLVENLQRPQLKEAYE